MKTSFKCELGKGDEAAGHLIEVHIIGRSPKDKPYVSINVHGLKEATMASGWIPDEDLERFAVNILKALKSKKLK